MKVVILLLELTFNVVNFLKAKVRIVFKLFQTGQFERERGGVGWGRRREREEAMTKPFQLISCSIKTTILIYNLSRVCGC